MTEENKESEGLPAESAYLLRFNTKEYTIKGRDRPLINNDTGCVAPNGRLNQGKHKLSLVDTVIQELVADVMEIGAIKYPDSPWQSQGQTKGYDALSLLDCALRHINQYKDGVEFDEEFFEKYGKKIPHYAFVVANMMMLARFDKEGTLNDTRNKGGK